MSTRPTLLRAYAAASRLMVPDTADLPLPGELLYLPAGLSSIHAGSDEPGGYKGQVMVDAATAELLHTALLRLRAEGHRAWIDADHSNGAALGDIREFTWAEGRGVVARVDWTPAGERALREKAYCAFSPAFLLDRATSRPCALMPGEAVGALVNAPAFGVRLQLIAASAVPTFPPTTQPKPPVSMNKIAEKLGLPPEATEDQILSALATLQAGSAKDEIAAALKTAKAEADALKIEAARLKSDLAARPIITASAVQPGLEESLKAYDKGNVDVRAKVLAGSLRKQLNETPNVMRVLAANSLATLTGELVLQQALPLLKLKFPLLSAISTDFSSENSSFGQALKTRTRSLPAVVDYSTTTGYASSDVTTTDVPVTIDAHKAVQIEFNANEIAGTSRDLFKEQVEGISYQLGKVLVDALYARITAGNFTNATTQAVGGFARATVIKLTKALMGRGAPDFGLFVLLNQDYFEALANDTSIVALATQQKAELITEYRLPKVASLQPYEAVNLPNTGNLVGFAGAPDALVLATRLPADYSKALPGSNNGSISTLTNADTGISLAVTQFVDHTLGKAVWRAALMYGTARGQASSGQRLISA